MIQLTILGSTGSVGINTLLVIKRYPDLFKIKALVAGKNVDVMLNQCLEFNPELISMKEEKYAKLLRQKLKLFNLKVQVLSGIKSACDLASLNEVDTVISAIVGIQGLMPTFYAIKAGKTILLANKESLIVCGHLFMRELSISGAKLLPIDSEHSAIFQNLPKKVQEKLGFANLKKNGIKSIILTGSGGPFLKTPLEEFSNILPKHAISHPNWKMGKKISVDSATMMNKGLEYIEARLLFNASDSEIEIIIHPQSIVHSMVCYFDGSILAHLGAKDMRIPISYALTWPNRIYSGADYLNISSIKNLSFYSPDFTRYPCLKLAIETFIEGQSAIIILNAANEIAVDAFLRKQISFNSIYKLNKSVVMSFSCPEPKSIEDIIEIDRRARAIALNKISLF
ncbi:1-deoxy-D-xylulose-5-phosphate reductoisomerase [Buchnera aphidicola (Neophyllaphis podocarpi)]|uniref:1-deoxy-D-xylulose-5-phosphate reductoisomerase n=1 Tax=Buchnera aphidicola TaxID=9 RepID=UPI0031B84E4C